DASCHGLGAVLGQEYADKNVVIAYASRTLSAAERKYRPSEREALGIMWATQHFRPYIEGQDLTIRSDCKALTWLREVKDPTGRLARWSMKLQNLNIDEIKYRPRKENSNCDAFSKYPTDDTPVKEDHEIAMLETVVNIWE
ncbi:unnamed protein product, partial [Didymodactylos carnosus]